MSKHGANRSWPPDRVGRYQLGEMIGEGGFGEVYQVDDPEFPGDAIVAKILKPRSVAETDTSWNERYERFLSEATLTRELSGAGVIAVRDKGTVAHPELGAIPFYIMELAAAGTLRKVIEDLGRSLNPDELRGLIEAIAKMLIPLHTPRSERPNGVVHRDLKPTNLLIKHSIQHRPVPVGRLFEIDHELVAADFGSAKAIDPGTDQMTGAVGTKEWCAPEQLELDASVDARADIFAATAIIVWAMTGVEPNDRWLPAQPLFSQEVLLSTGSLKPELERGLSPEREDRHSSIAKWRDALLDCLADSPILVDSPLAESPTPIMVDQEPLNLAPPASSAKHFNPREQERSPSRRGGGTDRSQWPIFATAGALLLVAALVVYALTSQSPDGGDPSDPAGPTTSVEVDPPGEQDPNSTTSDTEETLDGTAPVWNGAETEEVFMGFVLEAQQACTNSNGRHGSSVVVNNVTHVVQEISKLTSTRTDAQGRPIYTGANPTANELFVGTAQAETIEGHDGHDILCGFKGDDYLVGNAGHDILIGGEGLDVQLADHGTDYPDLILADIQDFDMPQAQGFPTWGDPPELQGEGVPDYCMAWIAVKSDSAGCLRPRPADASTEAGFDSTIYWAEEACRAAIGRHGTQVQLNGSLYFAVEVTELEPSSAGSPPRYYAFPAIESNNIIVGTDGSERLGGFGGNDIVCGGEGDDSLAGNDGNDILIGQGGVDDFTGNAGVDIIEGDTDDLSGPGIPIRGDDGPEPNPDGLPDYCRPAVEGRHFQCEPPG